MANGSFKKDIMASDLPFPLMSRRPNEKYKKSTVAI